MDAKNLLVERGTDGVVTVTINRPEVRNALNRATWLELREVIRRIQDDSEARALIITGLGEKAFAAGSDINSLRERTIIDALSGEVQLILSELESLRVPVVAAVNGVALGGGCELALACDIRIAAEAARFGLPETRFGIIPGAGGTQRLSRLVGPGVAKYLILTGEIVDAQEALRLGLVSRVVPAPELMAAARETVGRILKNGPLAIRMAKMVINSGHSVELNTALLVERLAQTVLFGTTDHLEGLDAFLEKRTPEFRGR